MAELKIVILPTKKLSDGSHKIRIAISHRSDTRYIVTRYKIDNESQFKNGRITKREDAAINNRKLASYLQDLYDALDLIDPDYYTCAQLKEYLEQKTIAGSITTISLAFDAYIAMLREKGSLTTIPLYEIAKRRLIECHGDMKINSLSNVALMSLDNYMRKKYKLNDTTIRIYMARISAVINYAQDQGYCNYRINPFKGYSMPQSAIRMIDLSVEDIRKVRDAELKEDGKHNGMAKVRDFWMLSLYLGGVNIQDLLNIRISEDRSEISYIRQKTKAKNGAVVSLAIQPEALAIIEKYITANNTLDFRISAIDKRRYISKTCGYIRDKLAISDFMFYSARKSFSQHAYNLGISIEVIEYILGHSINRALGNRAIINYVRVLRVQADEAIRKVLDYINADIIKGE